MRVWAQQVAKAPQVAPRYTRPHNTEYTLCMNSGTSRLKGTSMGLKVDGNGGKCQVVSATQSTRSPILREAQHRPSSPRRFVLTIKVQSLTHTTEKNNQ